MAAAAMAAAVIAVVASMVVVMADELAAVRPHFVWWAGRGVVLQALSLRWIEQKELVQKQRAAPHVCQTLLHW